MGRGLRGFAREVREIRNKKGFKRATAFSRARVQRLRRIAGIPKGKPFLTEPRNATLQRLRRRVLPRQIKQAASTEGAKQKEKLVRELFGQGGKELGLVVVKPFFIGSTGKVRGFLKKLGCEIVYSKPAVMSKQQLWRLYGYALSSSAIPRDLFENFPVHALDLLSGPSRVVVFKHATPEEYVARSRHLQEIKRHGPKQFAELMEYISFNIAAGVPRQTVLFDLFRGEPLRPRAGTLKAELVLPALKRAGFSEKAVRGRARQIDALGLVESLARKGSGNVAMSVFPGVRVPRYRQLFGDAMVLLTAKDLKKIAKKVS